ncbi:MAG TPA: hypothetical protein VKU39_02725 [Streptosporangiaceae bacterium]|nr:hypothetical protein [Streptosporangiaceae bacterium]
MKIRVVVAGTFVALTAGGCGTASQPAVNGPTGSGAMATPMVFDCLDHAVVKPRTYILACADNGSLLIRLSWTSWTSQQAVARGIHEVHDCTPSCANSTKWDYYPAVITVWRPEPVPGHAGKAYFSRLIVRYTTSARPPMYMNYGRLVPNPAQWSKVLGW